MIVKIDHTLKSISEEIWNVFQASYSREAKLIKAVDFPPLKRTIDDFLSSSTVFYALYREKRMTGLIEVKESQDATHIQSLVVYPKKFRQGVGLKLVDFVLNKYHPVRFTVETAVDNYPAIRLYLKLGFKEYIRWDTDHGIRKVRFEKFNQ